jgi:hypothetical protein
LFEKPHRVVCCYPEHVYETAQRLDLRWMREGITFGQETDMR